MNEFDCLALSNKKICYQSFQEYKSIKRVLNSQHLTLEIKEFADHAQGQVVGVSTVISGGQLCESAGVVVDSASERDGFAVERVGGAFQSTRSTVLDGKKAVEGSGLTLQAVNATGVGISR